MKFLLYSDLHIRPGEFLGTCDLVLSEIGRLVEEREIDYIINGGDTFHTRGIVNTSALNVLDRHYSAWRDKGFKQIILVGNHDQEDREGKIHPICVYRDYPGWSVIEKPTFIGALGMAFFPYMDTIENGLAPFSPISDEVPVDAVVHWGIQGARRNDNNVDSEGYPVANLAKFRKVFAGHYHYRNAFDNVQYIGSPYQQDFGEMGQDKGVLIWDNVSDTVEFIEIKGTRKHYDTLVMVKKDGKSMIGIQEEDLEDGDAIRIKIEGDKELISSLKRKDVVDLVCGSKTPGLVQINRNFVEKSFSRLNIDAKEIHSTDALMTKYVGHVKTSLNKEKLMEIGRENLNAHSS